MQRVVFSYLTKSSNSSLILALTAFLFAIALAPSAHAGLAAADATPNSVTLHWTAPGDDGETGTASEYDIRYSSSTITEANWDAAIQVSGEPLPQAAGTPEEFEVSGLEPNTTYYFAIKAADEIPNWSDISNVAIQTTAPEDTPPAAIADVGLDNPGENSLRVSWTAPGDDGTSGTASTYDLRYSTSTITEANWDAATVVTGLPTPSASGSSESVTITGLSAGTTYYVAIKTADEVPNWSALSNVASGTTSAESTPPAVIAGLGAVASTPSSVILSWTAPGDDGNSGTASEYDIRYSTSTITLGNWNTATQVSGEPSPRAAGSSEAHIVSGLNPSTEYYFAIRTADEVPNWSGLSNNASATTLDEDIPPDDVIDLEVIAQSPTSITVSWTAPGDDAATGTAAIYDLRYGTASISDGNWDGAMQCDHEPSPRTAGQRDTCVMNGLDPETTYYFALKTADEVPNWSGLSNIAVGATSTETTPPGTIANLGAGSPGEGSVVLNWTAPGDDGFSGTAAQYDIRYATSAISAANWNAATPVAGEPSPQTAGSAESFTVTGLNSGTQYWFAIRTSDEVPNWSAISNSPSATTLDDATAPGAVTELAAVLPTLNSLTLIWPAPGDDGMVGQATTYDLRFSTAPINEANWPSASRAANEPSPSTAGTPETLTVAGLAEATTYYFVLRTADEEGNWSDLSNVASNATATDATPPATIKDLTATAGEEDGEINLSWTAPGDDGNVGRAAAYYVKYYQQPITLSNWDSAFVVSGVPFPATAGSDEAMTVSGLVPGQLYYLAIRTIDDALNLSDLSNSANAEATLNIVAAADDMAQPASPPSGAVMPTARPLLVVRNANDQSSNVYLFEVATDSAFSELVANGLVNQQGGGETTWKIPVRLVAQRDYFWRVRTNGEGYSSVMSFGVTPATHPFPNPARFSELPEVTFTDLAEGDELILLTTSGDIVRRWSNTSGDDIVWDGTNESGRQVASGTYLWYTSESGSKGKLLVVR